LFCQAPRQCGRKIATRPQFPMEAFIYIERYYNWLRRRSALGYQSPEDFERAYY